MLPNNYLTCKPLKMAQRLREPMADRYAPVVQADLIRALEGSADAKLLNAIRDAFAEAWPTVKALRLCFGMTQEQFSERYRIPLYTLRKWDNGTRSASEYIFTLIAETKGLWKTLALYDELAAACADSASDQNEQK